MQSLVDAFLSSERASGAARRAARARAATPTATATRAAARRRAAPPARAERDGAALAAAARRRRWAAVHLKRFEHGKAGCAKRGKPRRTVVELDETLDLSARCIRRRVSFATRRIAASAAAERAAAAAAAAATCTRSSRHGYHAYLWPLHRRRARGRRVARVRRREREQARRAADRGRAPHQGRLHPRCTRWPSRASGASMNSASWYRANKKRTSDTCAASRAGGGLTIRARISRRRRCYMTRVGHSSTIRTCAITSRSARPPGPARSVPPRTAATCNRRLHAQRGERRVRPVRRVVPRHDVS